MLNHATGINGTLKMKPTKRQLEKFEKLEKEAASQGLTKHQVLRRDLAKHVKDFDRIKVGASLKKGKQA
jgi:hypothetical protein